MDGVIETFVLCSVDDIYASLREIKKVLKPSGTYIFMNHIAAPGDLISSFTRE
ncbi:hypothetical protein ZOSMA_81G00100 [Zostera marina]|uniref:Methyltransferase type 11 domain-containing protein n=1 Tax=Zostera marina TaxID=29655 RepID=A0A0K9NLY6_ZOSMR|nr:hypothetical protein ZOSMA_81G00100 [Zostera marina]